MTNKDSITRFLDIGLENQHPVDSSPVFSEEELTIMKDLRTRLNVGDEEDYELFTGSEFTTLTKIVKELNDHNALSLEDRDALYTYWEGINNIFNNQIKDYFEHLFPLWELQADAVADMAKDNPAIQMKDKKGKKKWYTLR